MEEYLGHWWAGDLALFYYPFDLTMQQFNKLLKIGQYAFGLLGVFELIHFSTVMRQFHFVTIAYFMLNRLPWLIINIPATLAPKLITGLISVFRGDIPGGTLVRSIVFPHVKATIKHAESNAKENIIARSFQWLANHPLSDSARRITIFISFAILSFGDLFTS